VEKDEMNLKEMEKTITRLDDIEQIKVLQNKYLYWLVDREWDKIIDCFTEDASVDIGKHGLHKGKAEFTRLFKEKINKMNVGTERNGHFVIQPIIEVDGDTATGQWQIYVMVLDPALGNAGRWIYGNYNCRYQKINGQWKFTFLKVPGESLI
jgi:hypothetical protein